MNMKMNAWGKTAPSGAVAEEPTVPSAERFLTLLAEGTSLNVPVVDDETYKGFRAAVASMGMKIPDRLPDDDKLEIVRNIVHEFENYRASTETMLRDRQSAWRMLGAMLLRELLSSLGIDAAATGAAQLRKQIPSLTTAEDIQAYQDSLNEFLHPCGCGETVTKGSPLKVADLSTANDNAAGLRGGGAAVEQLKKVMERGGTGFVVIFRLSCLEVISQRFGVEAVQDCLMAVSAFLTHSLNSDDVIYHWSDSSLLAILQGRPNEHILTAELQRVAAQNRDITINIGARSIMVRVPMAFELTPIEQMRSAEDLYTLSVKPATRW
jgi:GGDEF domain-containing protein